MKLHLFVPILVPGIVATTSPDAETSPVPTPTPVCAINSVYSDCASLCPPTCLEVGPRVCPAVCRPGCVCKPGYVLNVLGVCVPKALCLFDLLGSLFKQKDVDISEVETSEDRS
ncbi:hypothetical protein V2G26_010620 [Clonostachys chloroleuca]